MPGGLRAPLYLNKGEYSPSDFRSLLTDVRGTTVGVVPGAAADGLKVSAVSGSSARVAVAGGRAWIPATSAGVRNPRESFYVELPAPGVAFNLATPSASADRWDLIVARVSTDTDATAFAEVPLATFVPGDLTAGWTLDVVKGTDGGAVPSVPFDSYLILAKIKVRKGSTSLSATDIEDVRYTTAGQSDPTVLAPIRTAAGQGVAAVATSQARGGLIYSTDEDRLYVKGATDARPVTYRPTVFMFCTGKGATGWWGADAPGGGNGRMLMFDGPAAPYDRIGILSYQMRYSCPPGREGWTSAWVLSNGVFQWESMRSYMNTGGVHAGTAQVQIPKNTALAVYIYLYSQGGSHQFDEWQSNGQMTVIPAE
ncbi:hypothetical protein [Kitasatospora sp. MBT66]|uniref:hypothetical protein n=1 Tax=Kitasatospora sp. MBT66 TaxID=1444769 RepID=UPI0005B9EFB3|nr:hypothetical protein [Kitasatospora sp. MBT66]